MITAIDFGHSHVKIVQAEQDVDGIKITNIGSKSVIDDLNKFNIDDISKSHWVATIQDLCSEMGIIPKKVKKLITSLSGHHISIKQLTTLEMEDEDLMASLEFEAKKHIPLDGTEAILDYHILGQNKDELDKNDVLLIATTKNTVTAHDSIVKGAGFKSGIFDADAIALSNAYIESKELPEEGVDVIINIGNKTTTLLCWGKNHRFFIRELDIAGHHFTLATMKSNNLNYEEAEALKIEKGIEAASTTSSTNSEEHDPLAIKVAENTVYANLTEELRKTLKYYMKTSNGAFFNKFYLCGGSAITIGLIEFIADSLNVDLELFSPIESFKHQVDIENPSQFTTVLGMAFRGMNN